jgi:FkbM family methyltransferase
MSDPIFSELYAGASLLKWQVAHEMNVRLENNGLVVSDTAQYSYHLLRLRDSEFLYRLVRIKCLLRRFPTSNVNFYIHHYGNLDVAEIAFDGTIVDKGISRFLTVDRRAEDLLEIELEFLNCHPTISIGCSSNHHRVYVGNGCDQFAILQIRVETRDATAELSRIPENERIRIIDVGAQEGLPLKWMLKADRITPVLFEPIPSEAEILRKTISRIPGGQVVENALAHTSGTRKLHIAAASGCSSLREPNFEFLKKYSVGKWFQTIGEQDVCCTRYDELYENKLAPMPDVIKIDVQGFEYEVLLGFGHLLETCIGIELETHFYHVYRGQKIAGEIVDFLADFGFVLRAIKQQSNFDGDFVEFNAFFTKRREEVLSLPEVTRKKFSLLTQVWELAAYF